MSAPTGRFYSGLGSSDPRAQQRVQQRGQQQKVVVVPGRARAPAKELPIDPRKYIPSAPTVVGAKHAVVSTKKQPVVTSKPSGGVVREVPGTNFAVVTKK